jgi:uncharacterized membrane protein YkvA (DUF1232 family)
MNAVTTSRRLSAFRTLWRAFSRRGRPGEPDNGQRLRAVPDMVTDTISGRYPEMGRGRLALFAIALLYLVSPVDVIPEMLFTVFGLGDDAVVAMWLGGSLLVEADRYLGWRRMQPTVVDGELVR